MNYLTSFNKLNRASTLKFLGSAITWSGLPYYAVLETKNINLFALLFVIQAVVGIFANTYGALIIDKVGPKKIVLFCSSLASIALFISYLCLPHVVNKEFCLLFLGICLSVLSNLSDPAMDTWIGIISKKIDKNLMTLLAQRNIWLMLAKLIGFSVGPLIFGYIKEQGLLCEAVLFTVEVLLVLNIIDYKYDVANRISILFKFNNQSYYLFVFTFFNGILLYSILNICLKVVALETNNNSFYIGLLWGCASVFSLVSSFLIKQKLNGVPFPNPRFF